MPGMIIQWIDFLWLPLVFLVVEKQHRFYALGFVICCLFSLRLEYELLEAMETPGGITGLVEMPPYIRGLIVYSLAIMLFLGLSHFSRRTEPVIYMAAAISLYISTFVVSMCIMAI
jgi:hypothetical protein